MNKRVVIFLADGFEMVEALATMDVLVRGGVEVKLVSVTGKKEVKSSQNVIINADELFDNMNYSMTDVLVVPGGMPGAETLNNHEGVVAALTAALKEGRRVAAICAGPMVLGSHGMLRGKKCTCYPGYEGKLDHATVVSKGVVTDGNITTGRGMGFAVDFGLELLKLLTNETKALETKVAIQHPDSI